MSLGNTFEEVLGTRRSDFVSLVARMREAGATEVRMTGSGSAVFGILPIGMTGKQFLERLTGSESVYLVHSRGTGLARQR